MRSFLGCAGSLMMVGVLLVATGCEHKTRKYGKAKSAADEPTNTNASGAATSEPGDAPKWEQSGATTSTSATGPSGACMTTCGVDASSTLPGEDQRKIANSVDPLLKESWSCLKRVGAYKIEPTVMIRIASDGRPLMVRFDVGGYEDLNCMKEIERRFPNMKVSNGANVKCALRCN